MTGPVCATISVEWHHERISALLWACYLVVQIAGSNEEIAGVGDTPMEAAERALLAWADDAEERT
jgi:hypothetical protein